MCWELTSGFQQVSAIPPIECIAFLLHAHMKFDDLSAEGTGGIGVAHHRLFLLGSLFRVDGFLFPRSNLQPLGLDVYDVLLRFGCTSVRTATHSAIILFNLRELHGS